jgi:adenylate cyclase
LLCQDFILLKTAILIQDIDIPERFPYDPSQGDVEMNTRFKKFLSISPLKIGLIIILGIVFLYFLDFSFLRFMELKMYDLRMASRGDRKPGGEVVIAAIDEKSLSELGRWPWSRAIIANLVNTLKQNGAKAVGFDVVFSEPDNQAWQKSLADFSREAARIGLAEKRLSMLLQNESRKADMDSTLAEAIKKSDNITLGYFFHTVKENAPHLTEEDIRQAAEKISVSKYPAVQYRSKPDTSRLIAAYAVVPNISTISDAAQGSGYFNAFPDSDGVLRWAPLAIRFRDDLYASLSVSLLMQYLDWPMLTITVGETGVEGIKIGDLGIPVEESGRMLINYLGPGKTFPHYSISDILKGRIGQELLKDKIVLVGATATGIYDLRVTPYSAVFPGVEVHANIIDNLLHGDFIRRPGWAGLLDIGTIVLLGLIASFLLVRTRAIHGLLLALAIIGSYISLNCYLFSRYNLWLNLLYPVISISMVYLGITICKYVTEEREKKKIRNAFQFYLTSSVITEMLKDPSKLKLGGDKKDLSVLFSDIRGFTTISEKMNPEELVHLLNEYLTAMTNIVFQYDGLLDKYMGDAIMAVFGAPLNQPDHAERACRTALDMIRELRELQLKWKAEGRPHLDIGIGINSGDMVVGNMGSEMRFDYTVMGDSVNLGSRLEGINKEYGTNIVISEYTYIRIKDRFICRELDSVKVKGKYQPVKIYELLAEGNSSDAAGPYGYIKFFNEGLTKYKLGYWNEAVESFQKVLAMHPSDHPSKLYIARCMELQDNPPEAWDGIYVMTKK